MAALRIGLRITDRCSLDCAHCLRDPARAPRDLPLTSIERVLAETQALGIRSVSLTGGEPALHPHFEEILDRIAALGLTWDMVTSGDRFARTERALRASGARRAACRSVTINVDGDEATHEAIRGEGTYGGALSAISRLVAMEIPFGIQMTVHARNAADIDSVGLTAARLGAKHVSFAMAQPTGTHFDREIALPPSEWQRLRDRIESLARALRITVVLAEGWPDDAPQRRCDALRGDTLHIDVEGRLSLCCNLSGVPGGAAEEIAGDASAGLERARPALAGIIEMVMARRAASRGEWSRFSCNQCLAGFGKPHWQDAGAAGPAARRERWQGAWAKPSSVRLPVVR